MLESDAAAELDQVRQQLATAERLRVEDGMSHINEQNRVRQQLAEASTHIELLRKESDERHVRIVQEKQRAEAAEAKLTEAEAERERLTQERFGLLRDGFGAVHDLEVLTTALSALKDEMDAEAADPNNYSSAYRAKQWSAKLAALLATLKETGR